MEQAARSWWKEAVVYQVYPRSFCDSNGDGVGDLNGITEKLPYIRRLGATAIWLNPVYRSPNVDNGYDISDYYDIQPELGTMADFERLLARAHSLGLRVVMDLVVNHTSSRHPWFIESRQSRRSPRRDWYIWRDPAPGGGPPNNWGSNFGGPAWTLDEATGQYYLHLFAPQQPDLNWENPAVRDAVFRMMDFWFQKGIDGFRMDVISLISKGGFADGPLMAGGVYGDPAPQCANGPRVHEYLREMNRRVLSRYDCLAVGENAGNTPAQALLYAGFGRGELSMAFQFDLMDVDGGERDKWTARRTWRPADIKEVMTRWQTALEGKAWNALFWENHDQPRCVSRFGDDATEENRVRSAKMLATCLFLMQGTPFIYQGQELGMTNTRFDDIARINDVQTQGGYRLRVEQCGDDPARVMETVNYISREHARTPMPWTDGPNGGFTAGTPWIPLNPNFKTVNAAAQVGAAGSVYEYYRALLALRRENDVLLYGRYALVMADSPQVYAYTRTLDGRGALVACNFTGRPAPCPALEAWRDAPRALGNYPDAPAGGALRPYECAVYLPPRA